MTQRSTPRAVPDWWRSALGALFDLSAADVEQLLRLVDDPHCWMLGPSEGTWIIRVPPGPRRKGAVAFLIRGRGGARLERGPGEVDEVLLLQGALREHPSGRPLRASEESQRGAANGDVLELVGEEECIAAVLRRRT